MFNEAFDEQSGALLEERINYWYGRGRADRIYEYVDQLLRVYPNHPRLLEIQSLLALQVGDMEEAQRLYKLLVEVAPHSPEAFRLEEMVALEEQQRFNISDARMLALAGRYQESIDTWRKVFPEGPQAVNLAIEYWQVVARNGEAEQALQALEQLSLSEPYSIPLKFAVIRTRLSLGRVTKADQTYLLSLLKDSVYVGESFSLARGIAVNMPENEAALNFIRAILEQVPGHAELTDLAARIAPIVAQQNALEASGAYSKQLKGLAALENGQPLEAERWLREAWQAGANTATIAGGLGYATMRQGRHAEGLYWFRQAQALEPDTQVWEQMIQVTTFWRDVQVFDSQLSQGNGARAEVALNRIKSHSEREQNMGLIYLKEAQLLAYLEKTEQAARFYQRALGYPQSADQAAWGLFGYYRDSNNTAGMDRFYTQLPPALKQQLEAPYLGFKAAQWQQEATTLAEQGNLTEAYQALLQANRIDPSNPWVVARLADYEVAQGNSARAVARFEELVTHYPSNDAWFAYGLLLASIDQPEQALQAVNNIPANEFSEGNRALAERVEQRILLAQFDSQWRTMLAVEPQLISRFSPAQQVSLLRIMASQAELDDKHYMAQFEQAIAAAPSEQSAEVYALASEFAAATGQRERAYEWSLEAIQEQRQQQGVSRSVWLQNEADDWRITGLRRQALAVAEQSEKVLTIGFDQSQKPGTPDITELTNQTLMLHLKVPFASRDGFWFVQADPTQLNAGEADLDNSYWRDRYGTGLLCENDCPTGVQETNKDVGIGLGIGADFEKWWFDVGRSPLGFERSEWVGSLGYRFGFAGFGANIKLDRRVLTSTKISFAGQQDPFSDRVWGPAIRQGLGLGLGLSWDQGERFGWWASLGADYYTGHELARNSRWYAYTGGYMRAYDTEPLAVTVGLTSLFWGFDKDLSQVNYGHGNYYSPKLFQSLSMPVTVFGRVQRFSYLLRGSIGYSSSKLAAADFYPNHPGLQQQAIDIEGATGVSPFYEAGTGGGLSHSLTGNLEYQLNKHWYVGLSVNLVRSETFSPNQGLLYLRYHFGGYNLPVARPPAPPTPYMNL